MSYRLTSHKREKDIYGPLECLSWLSLASPELQDVVSDPHFLLLFYDFLRTMHSEEVLTCWLEIEIFKASLLLDRHVIGRDIIKRFLKTGGPGYLGAEFVLSDDLESQIQSYPSRSIFDIPQLLLWDILSHQWFPKLLQTETLRKIFQETNVKQRRKELIKACWKAFRTQENIVFSEKLTDYHVMDCGVLPLIPNVSQQHFQPEDLIYSKELLVTFMDYIEQCGESNHKAIVSFWFEVELYKNNFNRNPLEGDALFKRYIESGEVAMVMCSKEELLHELLEKPDANSFYNMQNYYWKMIQKKFYQFEESYIDRICDIKVNGGKYVELLQVFDQLNALRLENLDNSFRTNKKNVENKIRDKIQSIKGNFVDIWNVLSEKETAYMFIDYMQSKCAAENIRFWIDSELFKYRNMEERKQYVNVIWDVYFVDERTQVNVDKRDRELIREQILKQKIDPDIFTTCQENIYEMINYHFRNFLTTEQGQKVTRILKKRKSFKPINRGLVTEIHKIVLSRLTETPK